MTLLGKTYIFIADASAEINILSTEELTWTHTVLKSALLSVRDLLWSCASINNTQMHCIICREQHKLFSTVTSFSSRSAAGMQRNGLSRWLQTSAVQMWFFYSFCRGDCSCGFLWSCDSFVRCSVKVRGHVSASELNDLQSRVRNKLCLCFI